MSGGPRATSSSVRVESGPPHPRLAVPRGRPELLRRSGLLADLQGARDRSLVSMVAPPGYGKTSALVQWAGADPRPVAWLTADDGDNDPVALFTDLASALRALLPIDASLFTAIASPTVSIRAVVGRLLTAIADGPDPVIVVIDDAHRITDRTALDALAELISHLPPGSQMALASREPVDLPIPRWRSQGMLLEIGPRELAMDVAEATELIRQRGLDLPEADVARLVLRTEGWPALLGLAAAAADRAGNAGAGRAATEHAATDVDIAAYLRAEVFDQRSPDERSFLVRTSILDRLTGPLCDAVMGGTGSASMLERLARSTVLVTEVGGAYRYHSLLGGFLRRELDVREPGHIAELHHRAASWLDGDGDTERAVMHALAAHHTDHAADLIGRALLRYHWSGRRATVRAWFRQLGEDALARHPWLAVLAAWEELAVGDMAAAVRLAEIAERARFSAVPPDGTASFSSGRSMLRATMGRHGARAMLDDAAVAVHEELPGSGWRDFALWQLAIAQIVNGDPAAADSLLVEAAAAAVAVGNRTLAYCITGHRALLVADRGDWTAATRIGAEASALGAAGQIEGYLSSTLARIAEVRLAIHRGDLDGARRDLARAVALRPLISAAAPGLALLCLMGLARAHLGISDAEGARALLTQAEGVVRIRPDLGVLPAELAALRATTASLPIGIAGASALTPAELRVLAMLPYYLSFKEIAQRLGVKATTVKTHALSIYGKLGASTRSEAVDLAVEAGLLEPFPMRGPSVSAIR